MGMWLMMSNTLWVIVNLTKIDLRIGYNQIKVGFRRRCFQNNFPNSLWPFRVHSDAILPHKWPNGLQTHDEQHLSRIHRSIHCGIFGWHLDLLRKFDGTIWSCSFSSSRDPSTWAICQKREVEIRSHINWVPWLCHLACWY